MHYNCVPGDAQNSDEDRKLEAMRINGDLLIQVDLPLVDRGMQEL